MHSIKSMDDNRQSASWIHLKESPKAHHYWQTVYVDHPHHQLMKKMKANFVRPTDYQVHPPQQVISSSPSSSNNLIIDSCECSCHSSSLDLSQDASSSSFTHHHLHTPPSHYCNNSFARSSTLSSSSPSRMVFKSSGRRLQHLWSAVKKLSPVSKFKSSQTGRSNNRGLFGPSKNAKSYDEANRIYLSSPDLSVHDLASIAHPRSHDDLDIIALTKANSNIVNSSDCQSIFSHTLPNRLSSSPSSQHHHPIAQRNISLDSDPVATLSDADSEQATAIIPENSNNHEAILRNYPFFVLDVHLKSGQNLLAKDSNGTSDPYVRFKLGKKDVYKSRIISKTLSPIWDENFTIAIDDIKQLLSIKAWDHDFGFSDDYLGSTIIDLTKLPLDSSVDLELDLTESGLPETDADKIWGQILLTLNLSPKTLEEKEQYYNKSQKNVNRSTSGDNLVKKSKTQQWDSVVSIVLVEGKNLSSKDDNGLSDPYVKFQIGKDRYKSKVVPKTLNPVWNERFSLFTFPNQSKILEFAVYDRDYQGRDDFMGKSSINLNNYQQEVTHKMWCDLEDGDGSICLMITISGTSGLDAVSSMSANSVESAIDANVKSKYSLWRTLANIHDVGCLELKVYRAEGLMAADLNGKSDPFCVIELVNTRVQTNTEYKTLSPEWNKVFTFPVKDIHEILEITVYDEDRDRKCEFLGKFAIPLLNIKNGEKQWFYLKDKKLRKKSKGKILLEMNLVYNRLRAYIRTFNPREEKVISEVAKFRRTVFIRNVNRVKNSVTELYKIVNWINSCFQWESKLRSITTFAFFLIITYFFQLFMIPFALLLLFLIAFIRLRISSHYELSTSADDDKQDASFDVDDDDDKETEEKKSLMEKVQAVTEVSATVQNILGMIASYLERVKNTFNYSVPFLSTLAIGVLTIATIILYFIPLRYLIMAWGINKFTKKLRNPNYISNNELLDFLSRVPDIDEIIMYRETSSSSSSSSSDPHPSPSSDAAKRKDKKKQQ